MEVATKNLQYGEEDADKYILILAVEEENVEAVKQLKGHFEPYNVEYEFSDIEATELTEEKAIVRLKQKGVETNVTKGSNAYQNNISETLGQ